jgi:hypothetical protein
MNKLSGGQLAGGNSTTEKAENDFYATDPETVKLFLDEFYYNEYDNIDKIWENACGNGNISETLKEYFIDTKTISTDLIDRGYGMEGIDFLNTSFNPNADLIITNPPFSLVNDFIKGGLKKTNRYLVYLCKIQLLETVGRKELLENSPLKYVYVHSKRQATWKNGEPLDPNGKPWATTMCLAWFVWDKEYKGEPIIKFL